MLILEIESASASEEQRLEVGQDGSGLGDDNSRWHVLVASCPSLHQDLGVVVGFETSAALRLGDVTVLDLEIRHISFHCLKFVHFHQPRGSVGGDEV